MQKSSYRHPTRGACCALILIANAALVRAGETRIWSDSDYSDFNKGVVHNLSLRSDGVVTLAPRFQELYDTSSAYLWAVTEDSKGNLYAGGGPGAKVYRLTPKGDKKVITELEGLEVHALAVDGEDRLYAATSPDGKVYRILPNGRTEVFYDPKSKYIWGLAFNHKGELFVATGDRGEIHRVASNGKGGLFFSTDETHARSLAVDGDGNLIVGTEPGGLVIRVSPSGQGFVLYQMAKREVTGVAIGRDGTVWAAAVGNKQPAPPPQIQPAAPQPQQQAPAAQPAGAPAQVRVAGPAPPAVAPRLSVTGGSEVYRIDPAGNPRRAWTHPQDIVYTMELDGDGRLLLGTGNKGYIYRIDSDTLHTALLKGSPTQVTRFHRGRNGRLFAVTGNVGKIYEIGPGLEREGSIESDVYDAGIFSQWGRLAFNGNANGGEIRITARSGNLDQPQKNWSPWSAPVASGKGDRVNCPPARFVQWKATLAASKAGHSPELSRVDLAYLPRNVEPRFEQVEITPPNYRFPTAAAPAPAAQATITLPPLVRRTAQARAAAQPRTVTGDTSTPAMQRAKGHLGARWIASDENGDALVYTVEIRGADETVWKTLREDVRENRLSFDSSAFPDGEYFIRVTASDSPGNSPAEALTASAESPVFLVDNTPPRVAGLTATRNGARLFVRWKAVDNLSNVKKAEYSLNGGEWTVAPPVGGLTDSPELNYELTIEGVEPGEQTLAVRVEDEYENQSVSKTVIREQ
jgi:sugar lactone lactonase YvrE